MAEKRKVIPIADETLTLFDAAQEMANHQKIERPRGVREALNAQPFGTKAAACYQLFDTRCD